MIRTVILNGLFVVAEYASSTVDTILYRLALIAIVVLLQALWIRAMVRSAVKLEHRRTLTSLADSLVPPQAHQDMH